MTVLTGGYASWVGWLDAFARGEDRPSTDLVPVDESLGPSMFGRLLQRISTAYTARAGRWSTILDERIAAAASGGVSELGAVLMNARNTARPLWALAESSLLPVTLRAEMRRALTEMLAETQRSLEDSARRQLGGEEVLAVLREHRLTVVPAPAPVPSPVVAPAGRRRVIL